MTKKFKTRFVEDSFVSSDCSVLESNFEKWFDAEFKRLISKGRDINKFNVLADPDSNEINIVCEEYTMKYNKDERVVDLVVNGEKNSSIWDDVVNNVPVQFASCIDNPMSFTYNISANTSGGKESYLFTLAGFNNFIPLFGLIPLEKVEEKIKNSDSLIESMSNIF